MLLNRRYVRPLRISLVPLIDVLFILLIYFMVTSVYLDLDMVSILDGTTSEGIGASEASDSSTVLIRLNADGQVVLRGETLSFGDLEETLRDLSGARVLILPSGGAPLQALAETLDMVTKAGVTEAQIVRIEGQ